MSVGVCNSDAFNCRMVVGHGSALAFIPSVDGAQAFLTSWVEVFDITSVAFGYVLVGEFSTLSGTPVLDSTSTSHLAGFSIGDFNFQALGCSNGDGGLVLPSEPAAINFGLSNNGVQESLLGGWMVWKAQIQMRSGIVLGIKRLININPTLFGPYGTVDLFCVSTITANPVNLPVPPGSVSVGYIMTSANPGTPACCPPAGDPFSCL
jgi:hypothetical protein